MPDRSLRLPLSFAFGLTHGGERGSTLLRDGRPSSPPQDSQDSGGSGSSGSGSSGSGSGSEEKKDDNPFAPPPEGTPDQPWRPRPGNGGDTPDDQDHSPWGSQWSDRQPGRSQDGGFGERPGQQGGGPGQEGGPSGPGSGSGMRWDPTDPAQRRARYALLSGMWAFFFALFGWRYVALLLGALALNWGISALRAKPKQPDPTAQRPPAEPASTKPQTTAAVSGLVTASLALAMVAATFAAQLVYRDYYTCVSDALTSQSKQQCESLLPEQLRPLLGDRD
ncbi:hypothetical protein ACGFSB_16855 [Streptomyces sp. NPDC048441]|uniref:hypothetical protein n=1 Tax=Streptomyces sp. NPDC048441 TaxID=3365552 RepID=UPI003712D82C